MTGAGTLLRWSAMLGLLAGGCAPLNESTSVGPVGPPPVIVEAPTPATFSGEPSVTGVSRADWQPVIVVAPVNDTQARPVYWESYGLFRTAMAREIGAYPTIESTVDVERPKREVVGLYAEGATDPLVQLGNLVAAPVRMVIAPPWSVTRGASSDFDRLPPFPPVVIHPSPEAASDRTNE